MKNSQNTSSVRFFDNDPNVYLQVGGQWYFYDPNRPPIGSGAMGKVFLGNNYQTGEEVAVKQLYDQYANNEDVRRRTEREASLSYSHPNLVEMLGYCIYCEKKQYYMWVLSRYVHGVNLDKFVEQNYCNLEPDLRVKAISEKFYEALNALGYLHNKGVIHRDIKPSNIMVDDNGHVHLMDLGIARVTESSGTTSGFVGTILYAPPEQILRDQFHRQVTEASDIYALGMTYYTVINGSNPFDSNNESDIMESQLTKRLPLSERLSPRMAKILMPVIWKATDKAQDKRYQSADEFRQAIMQALEESAAKPKSWLPWLIGFCVLFFVLLAVLLCVGA